MKVNFNSMKAINKRVLSLLSVAAILTTASSYAQVKVGDNPTTINANSALEIESTNKGFLLPRVELVAPDNPAPLTAHVEGMTVYNTKVTDDLSEGIYMNDGAVWARLQNTEVFQTNAFGGGAPTGSCTAGTIYTDTLATSPTLGQQWTCSAGTWVSYKSSVSSPFYRQGTTVDAGAGKFVNVSRWGSITSQATDGSRSATLINNGGLQLYRSASAPLPFVNGFIDFKKDLGASTRFMRISMSSIAAQPDWAIRFESKEVPWIMSIGADGNVGIKTYAPTAVLSVNGGANKPGGGSWGVFSDRRSKENIASYKKGINELMKINPVSFQYKKSMGWGQQRYVGVIAQDIEKILPEMVREIEVGEIKDFKEVDPNEFTYLLINSVQEQQREIETHKAEIAYLKAIVTGKLAQLESQMNNKERRKVSKRKKSINNVAMFQH